MDISKLNKAGEKAKEAATKTKQWVQSEISILPDRYVCPKCDKQLACSVTKE